MEEAQRLCFSTAFAGGRDGGIGGGSLPDAEERDMLSRKIVAAHDRLAKGTGDGSDMRGWLNFPASYIDSAEFRRILAAAETIKKADVLLVIGIGGSYLGARAVVEALTSRYYNDIRNGTPAIYFTGCNISESDYAALDAIIEGKDFCINVISKSGTTLEPALAFRHFRAKLEAKYQDRPKEADKRIFVTTDAKKGALLAQAKERGWKRFIVPANMGGRYSVLSAVGLLPIACAGVDVGALLRGAAAAQKAYAQPGAVPEDNACYWYAALRYHYYTRMRKAVELFAVYEPNMTLFGEWLKQLFGESDGKEFRGLFPASATFTTDLHSLGQYVQQGERLLFETVITFEQPANALGVTKQEHNGDELNYLAGKTLHEINETAFRATALAHQKGGCPSLHISLPGLDAESLGWLIYFFEKACAISGYMLGVNPFDQPGVEDYKSFMFALLGKPGEEHDKTRADLRAAYGMNI